jgi:hypothetical protein
MTGPHCPTCRCRREDTRTDVTAPFYELVLEIDRIWWAERTAARWPHKEAS